MGLMKVKTQWATISTPNERDKTKDGKERERKREGVSRVVVGLATTLALTNDRSEIYEERTPSPAAAAADAKYRARG